jgi:hypothetical protein
MSDRTAIEWTDATWNVATITRALSLTQPWATLVAIGAKKFETRSWRTPHSGWVPIHAAKGFPNDCRALCLDEPFRSSLKRFGFVTPGDLPRGQVLAIARLVGCIWTDKWTPDQASDEYAFGNYAPGRYAWQLEEVQRIPAFHARGSLGLWWLPEPIRYQAVA